MLWAWNRTGGDSSALEGSAAAAVSAPAYLRRGDAVEARFATYRNELRRFHDELRAVLKTDAPDLYAKLDERAPQPPAYGYGILPEIEARARAGAASGGRPRARSARYSWPWTEQKIAGEQATIRSLEAELQRARTLPGDRRRPIYLRLVDEYPRLPQAQRNIDEHIRYNRLWQAAIAKDRAAYDRGTRLHHAVLERQAIQDALAARDETAWRRAVEAVSGIDRALPRPQLESELRTREAALSARIHEATDEFSRPDFLRVERRAPHRRIVHVPLYTDIDDAAFVREFCRAVQNVWHLRDGADEFAVEVSVIYVPAGDLYRHRPGCTTGAQAACRPPRRGDHIDVAAHVALFPRDGGRLTTGAGTTHVTDGAIVLGPGEVGPHLLAHEFGHLLGFRDEYFRGYRDLGRDGFEVMEVVADPDDVMGAPGAGPVVRRQFEELVGRRSGR